MLFLAVNKQCLYRPFNAVCQHTKASYIHLYLQPCTLQHTVSMTRHHYHHRLWIPAHAASNILPGSNAMQCKPSQLAMKQCLVHLTANT